SSIIYSVPAFVIPQEGSSNNFVTTPIIEKVSQNMTLLIDHSTTVQSRIARVEQVSMQFNGTGNNVGFSFGITDSPPAGTPIPPFDASALFLNVDYVGTDSLGNKLNFSDPSMFASSPQVKILVNKDMDIAKLSDGCPDIKLLLFNEITGSWEETNKPVRDSTMDTATECGYILEAEHFSDFGAGGDSEPSTNHPPTASAYTDNYSPHPGDTVTLYASTSDPDDDPLSYNWSQTAGPTVTLSDEHAPSPSFVTPTATIDTDLTFEVVVSDGALFSDPSNVTITININDHAPIAISEAS